MLDSAAVHCPLALKQATSKLFFENTVRQKNGIGLITRSRYSILCVPKGVWRLLFSATLGLLFHRFGHPWETLLVLWGSPGETFGGPGAILARPRVGGRFVAIFKRKLDLQGGRLWVQNRTFSLQVRVRGRFWTPSRASPSGARFLIEFSSIFRWLRIFKTPIILQRGIGFKKNRRYEKLTLDGSFWDRFGAPFSSNFYDFW